MSSDSLKFQLFLVGVHCQFVALSVWYASNAHQRLLLFKVSHDHINCKKVDGVCSLDSLKICCMGCSTETDAWGVSSWKRGHAGSWIMDPKFRIVSESDQKLFRLHFQSFNLQWNMCNMDPESKANLFPPFEQHRCCSRAWRSAAWTWQTSLPWAGASGKTRRCFEWIGRWPLYSGKK